MRDFLLDNRIPVVTEDIRGGEITTTVNAHFDASMPQEFLLNYNNESSGKPRPETNDGKLYVSDPPGGWSRIFSHWDQPWRNMVSLGGQSESTSGESAIKICGLLARSLSSSDTLTRTLQPSFSKFASKFSNRNAHSPRECRSLSSKS